MTDRPQVLVRISPAGTGEIHIVGALEPDCLPDFMAVVRRAQELVGTLIVDVTDAEVSPIALVLLRELAHGDVRDCGPFAVRAGSSDRRQGLALSS
ncbi:hypothetical protein [Cellulomonas edaphi]|uniref:STAS domain-containing protein n=1 Tax=Cellulomonas edaphi TaxID=3053468 RepID=A0ABT7S7P3_9CELL|nr:hypothetical protein [Cellulomons edaphi]MDM7831638.1 hypothetical protein [Cellulomons edaphi]